MYPVQPHDLSRSGDDRRCEALAVWSRQRGVAKTTICYALGFALALKGTRILMVDADP